MIVKRDFLEEKVYASLRGIPVTALLGPRQCGKTTLARDVAKDLKGHYFDLEDPISLRRLSEPMTALRPLRGLVVIDEVQRSPELFPMLRVLADRKPLPARFLVLGSASPELLRQGSESLAGRINFIEMSGFDVEETGPEHIRRLWWRGGFPRSFVARTERDGHTWRENFIRTFLERDIQEFARIPATTLRRLWMMLAHYHGGFWSTPEIGNSLGESHPTIKRHVDLLTGTLMVRQLQPWFENIGKRQVKSTKVYIRDSGLLHTLLGVESFSALEGHPKIGASWEGFVVDQVARIVGERNIYYWATHSGAEIDMVILRGSRRIGVEIKYGDAPGRTKSMQIATKDLGLDRIFVVYPGQEPYPLDAKTQVIPVTQLRQALTGR